MKKLILATALLASSMSYASNEKSDLDIFCSALGDAAEAIMVSRYDGVTIEQVKENAMVLSDNYMYPYVSRVIDVTFKMPLKITMKGKFESINNASDKIYSDCMTHFVDRK